MENFLSIGRIESYSLNIKNSGSKINGHSYNSPKVIVVIVKEKKTGITEQ